MRNVLKLIYSSEIRCLLLILILQPLEVSRTKKQKEILDKYMLSLEEMRNIQGEYLRPYLGQYHNITVVLEQWYTDIILYWSTGPVVHRTSGSAY